MYVYMYMYTFICVHIHIYIQGHPRTRWMDAFEGISSKVLGERALNTNFWKHLAQDEETWQELEHDFVSTSFLN